MHQSAAAAISVGMLRTNSRVQKRAYDSCPYALSAANAEWCQQMQLYAVCTMTFGWCGKLMGEHGFYRSFVERCAQRVGYVVDYMRIIRCAQA